MILYDSCPVCASRNIIPTLSVNDFTVSAEVFEVWQCNKCLLRFTQNIPEADEISRYYQSAEYISHTDTTKGFINKLYHRVRRHTISTKRRLVERTTGKKKGKILDVGCGTGAFLQGMIESGWEGIGLEPDETARQKAQDLHGLNLESSEKMFSLTHRQFDAITMWHVLEHVHDLHGYINQLKYLLKPTGKILIAVPNYTSYDEEIYREFWAAYDVPRHLYHFSPSAMKELMSLHGLEINTEKPMWYDSFYVSMLSEKYKNGKSNIASAILIGLESNFKAMFNTKKCSSIIYVIGVSKDSQ